MENTTGKQCQQEGDINTEETAEAKATPISCMNKWKDKSEKGPGKNWSQV